MASPAGPSHFEYEPDDEQPGVSIRPLAQHDLDAILAGLDADRDSLLAATTADRPVVALRMRATVGRPGASAHAAYQVRRAAELAAWRRGAAGERRTARLLGQLERHGWAVLHDLAVPGSHANIDHLAIGPGGVFVIDSKLYTGRLHLAGDGSLWHGRYPLAPVLRAVRFEPTGPPKSSPPRTSKSSRWWLSMAPRCHGGRSWSRACRWCALAGFPACFIACRPSSGPNGPPGWPPWPGFGSVPRAERRPLRPSAWLEAVCRAGSQHPPP
jgi:hypothetical protein